ncbi:hypothetical protein D3C72_2233940 [compost metagenome]
MESADSTSRCPVRGSTPSAERLRRSSSSLGSGFLSPVSGLWPSLFQVNSAGGRSSPRMMRCCKGSQATASKALFWFSDGPRSNCGKSAIFSERVSALRVTMVNL